MKLQTLLLPLGLLAIAAIGFGVYSAASAPLPEGFPPPTPAGLIEVKHYPAYRSGTVTYQGQLANAAESAFNPLFRHISSNNISMTAPVEARYPLSTLWVGKEGQPDEQGEAEVSFLYRSPDVNPKQIAQGIRVEDIAPMSVVSIGVQGNYSYVSYQQHVEQLRHWLAQHPDYKVVGPPRRFFYDSPFILDALKRSEIQVPIQKVGG